MYIVESHPDFTGPDEPGRYLIPERGGALPANEAIVCGALGALAVDRITDDQADCLFELVADKVKPIDTIPNKLVDAIGELWSRDRRMANNATRLGVVRSQARDGNLTSAQLLQEYTLTKGSEGETFCENMTWIGNDGISTDEELYSKELLDQAIAALPHACEVEELGIVATAVQRELVFDDSPAKTPKLLTRHLHCSLLRIENGKLVPVVTLLDRDHPVVKGIEAHRDIA